MANKDPSESMIAELTSEEFLMLAEGYSERFVSALEAAVSAAEAENWTMWDEEMGAASLNAGRAIELMRAHRSLVESYEEDEDA